MSDGMQQGMDPMEQGASILEAAFSMAAQRGMNPSFAKLAVTVDPDTFETSVESTSVDGTTWKATVSGPEMAAAMGLEPAPAADGQQAPAAAPPAAPPAGGK